jgi:molecular chaperone DnaK
MSGEKAVGIDLGTTNSAMAWVDRSGRSAMIPNAEGEMLTPSIVLFGDQEVVVGKNARNAVTTHPDLVAQWVKRDMGAPCYSHPIHGQYLPPEVIQACVLRKLKLDIIGALGFDTQAVITVPAYFDELRRKATADAGEMAGLKVIDIVNEPTAAALAFGEAEGYLSPTGLPREELTVMVYDLGGGTFDATLLRLSAGNVHTLATDGDVQLGGHDWDQRLVDYAAEAFLKSHQLDPRRDAAALNRLFQSVMEAKHTLSARSRATIRTEFAGRTSEVQIAREQFEEMTADLLERTAYTSRQLLVAAGLQWRDVNRVLLVGGSTRMPMVARMLQKLAGIEPDRTVNPDEAVARGAALYAAHRLAQQAPGEPAPALEVTNVNAHSLGVEGIEQETLRKTNVILIPRNTALPARRMERFVTKSEGQRSIVIKVLEGESSLPGECTAIGRTVVRDLPDGLPKGWPVEVTFEYGVNGRLSVRALVPGTQHQAELDLERDVGLSGAGIARWKAPIVSAAGFEAFEAAVQDVLAATPATPTVGGSGIMLSGPPEGGWIGGMAPPPTRGGSPLVSSPLPLGATSWPRPAPPEAAAPVDSPDPLVPLSPQPAFPAGPAAPDEAAAEMAPAQPLVMPAKRLPPLFSSPLAQVAGHIIASLLGLGCGYALLRWFRPDIFPPLW